jgi:hypothetical protein
MIVKVVARGGPRAIDWEPGLQVPRQGDIMLFEGRAHRIDEVIWQYPVKAGDEIEVHLKARTFGT